MAPTRGAGGSDEGPKHAVHACCPKHAHSACLGNGKNGVIFYLLDLFDKPVAEPNDLRTNCYSYKMEEQHVQS